MTLRRVVCQSCFELVRGFGSMGAIVVTDRCEVCGVREGPGHFVHHVAAEHCHARLCTKMQVEAGR